MPYKQLSYHINITPHPSHPLYYYFNHHISPPFPNKNLKTHKKEDQQNCSNYKNHKK